MQLAARCLPLAARCFFFLFSQYLASMRNVRCAANSLNVNVVHFIIFLSVLAKHSILLSEAQRQLFKGRPGPNLYLTPIHCAKSVYRAQAGQDDLHYTSPSARVNLEWRCSHELDPRSIASKSRMYALWIWAQGRGHASPLSLKGLRRSPSRRGNPRGL